MKVRCLRRLSACARLLQSMRRSGDHVELDREAFSRKLNLKALRIPRQRSSDVRKQISPFLLRLPRVKPIQNDTDVSKNLVLLEENVADTIPDKVQSILESEDVELVDFELTVGYERLSAVEVLKEMLPEDVVVPSAFESVGSVAHMNLRAEHEPYKNAIGQVLLDKNPSIRTVINKVGTVENAYRLMEYEVLAGNPSLETEVRQSGCRFQLDFGKVYWNSRLEFEHMRLVDLFRPGETVLDLMAGIGPFAIPAAKKACTVIANDKNPDSYRYLVKNIELNNVVGDVLPFNLDARFCLRMALGHEGPLTDYLSGNYTATVETFRARKQRRQKKRTFGAGDASFVVPFVPLQFQHVVMNYPQYAVSFLDMFKSVFDQETWSEDQMPVIHCYAFMKEDEDPEIMKRKCEAMLGEDVKLNEATVHIVRDVAPSKVMCCISFKLPYNLTVKISKPRSLQAPADDRSANQPALDTAKKLRCFKETS